MTEEIENELQTLKAASTFTSLTERYKPLKEQEEKKKAALQKEEEALMQQPKAKQGESKLPSENTTNDTEKSNLEKGGTPATSGEEADKWLSKYGKESREANEKKLLDLTKEWIEYFKENSEECAAILKVDPSKVVAYCEGLLNTIDTKKGGWSNIPLDNRTSWEKLTWDALEYVEGVYAQQPGVENLDITPYLEFLEKFYQSTLPVEKRIKRFKKNLNIAKNSKPAQDLNEHIQGLLDTLYSLDKTQKEEWEEIVSGNETEDAAVAAGLQYLEDIYAQQTGAENLDITSSLLESLEDVFINTLPVEKRIKRLEERLKKAKDSKLAQNLSKHIQGLLNTLCKLDEEQIKEWKKIVSGDETEDVVAAGLQYLEDIYAKQPGAENLDITPSFESLEEIYENTFLVEQRITRFKKDLDSAKDSKLAQNLSKHMQGLLDILYNLNEEQIKEWKKIVSGDETEDVVAAGLQYLTRVSNYNTVFWN